MGRPEWLRALRDPVQKHYIDMFLPPTTAVEDKRRKVRRMEGRKEGGKAGRKEGGREARKNGGREGVKE